MIMKITMCFLGNSYRYYSNIIFFMFQGLNFQLAAVLLSLGVYTYVEYGMSVCLFIFLFKFTLIK